MKKATLEEAHTAFRPDKSGIINLSVIQNPIGEFFYSTSVHITIHVWCCDLGIDVPVAGTPVFGFHLYSI